jgi:plasmid stabilization system protein ParE
MREAVLFRPRARDDLESHALWVGRNSGERAMDFLDAVELTLKQLLIRLELGASRDWLSPHCTGIRFRWLGSFPFHFIFYRPADRGFEVIRILHATRDIGPLPPRKH